MRVAFKIAVLVAVACAALAAYRPEDFAIVAAWAALLCIAVFAATEYWVRRPVIQLTEFARQLTSRNLPARIEAGKDEIGTLAASLAEVRDALERDDEARVREAERRRDAEQAVRESEERYALAVRGANDALWEWNLRTGSVYYSPRWKALLDHREDDVGVGIDEWRDRIHPDDREAALRALDDHLAGRTDRYESVQRLRRKDGRWRWVLVRGARIRGVGDRPHRLVGLTTDIDSRKRVEQIVVGLAEGLANVHGEAFFRGLVKNFATVLGVQRAFITECCDDSRRRVRHLAKFEDGNFVANGEYDITGLPCDEVINGNRACIVASGVALRYPQDVGFESYIGIPIKDSENNVVGHLACLGAAPLEHDFPVELIFTLYAERAGLEIERQRLLSRLRAAA
jgi:PAS domain S-box-containing protein